MVGRMRAAIERLGGCERRDHGRSIPIARFDQRTPIESLYDFVRSPTPKESDPIRVGVVLANALARTARLNAPGALETVATGDWADDAATALDHWLARWVGRTLMSSALDSADA